MAKIVIEIEDLDNGNIKVTSTPKFKQIWSTMQDDPNHGASFYYAYKALRSIYETSKEMDATMKTLPMIQ